MRLPDGSLEEPVISAEEAASLAGAVPARPARVCPADPEKFRLLIESARIRLAYAHDRQFAVSLSGIRSLPHQIEAVYQRMLPQPQLRFLLADDPGAGKTIMAGLGQGNETSPSHRAYSDSLPGGSYNPVAGRNATLVRRVLRYRFFGG